MQSGRANFDFFFTHLQAVKKIFQFYQGDKNKKYLTHFNRVVRQLYRLAGKQKSLTPQQVSMLEDNLYSVFINTSPMTASQHETSQISTTESTIINNLVSKISYEVERKKFIRKQNKKISVSISQRIHNYLEKVDLANLNKDKYLSIFQTALSQYITQADRPGYEPTLFTRLRHSRKKYPQLIKLEDALKNETKINKQKDLIKTWLKSGLLQNDNHSFRNYFVDSLIEMDPYGDWDVFDNHPITFYDPNPQDPKFLYRGTALDPELAFVKGMQLGYPSKNIADYVRYSSESAGVSTTKDFNVANLYTNKLVHTPYGPQECRNGYVFQIHYRGCAGIDIDKSLGIKYTENTKKEVNIIDGILPEDIISYGQVKEGNYIPYKLNPNYNPAKQPAPLKSKTSLLRSLFTKLSHQRSFTQTNALRLQQKQGKP